MSMLWGRFRGKVDSVSTSLQNVSISRTERDRGEDDTVITRALCRYYAGAPPAWLVESTPLADGQTAGVAAAAPQGGFEKPRLQSRSTTDFSHIYSRQSTSRNSLERRSSQSPQPMGQPAAGGEAAGDAASQVQGRGKFSKLRHANW